MKIALEIFYMFSILCSAVTAFLFRGSLGPRKLEILAPFLAWVFLQELILLLLDTYLLVGSNTIVYHVYRILNVIVFAIIFYRIPFMAPLRKMILGLAALYILVNLMVFSFISSLLLPNSYLSLARGFVLTCYGIFFLFSYFSLDNRTEERYWTPVLWITIGILIFYPVISISLAFQKSLVSYGTSFYGFRLYQMIPQIMSVFMYSCFTYAFYLCKKKN